MLQKNANPILTKTQQKIEAGVQPDMKSAFQRIMLAGEKVMYSDETQEMVQGQLKQGGEPADVIGEGVAKLMGILMSQSKGTMPMKAAVPAATVLLCEALDFAEKAGMVQVTPDVLAKSMQSLSSAFLQLLGVGPEKLEMLMHKAQRPGQGAAPTQPAAQPPQPTPPAGGLVAQAQGETA